MPTATQVFTDVFRYLDEQPTAGTLQILQRAVLRKAQRCLERDGSFSIVDVPLAINEQLGGDPEVGASIAGAALLFYAAADVADDAADHDLEPDPWSMWGWEQAANTGVSLVFASLQYLYDRLRPDYARRLVETWVRAGTTMSSGQHVDLLGQNNPSPSVQGYLQVVEAKTGASFGAYARAVAESLDLPSATEFQDFGVSLGTMLQMISDVHELWSPGLSSDFVNRRLSLPILLALEQASPETRTTLNALLEGTHDLVQQGQLVHFLEQKGIKAYASLRIEVYRKRASELATRLGLGSHPTLRRLIDYPAFPSTAIPL